jgi:hypothetical protein
MPPVDSALNVIDKAAAADFRWWFVSLLVIGLLTVYFLARYFAEQISALQTEINLVRTEYETHLKTGNAEMVVALSEASQTIQQNSKVLADVAARLGLSAARGKG